MGHHRKKRASNGTDKFYASGLARITRVLLVVLFVVILVVNYVFVLSRGLIFWHNVL